MYIHVDAKSGTPLYLQVMEQVRLLVATGVLRPGDQLPTVRDLAARLRVNPNTIARAYRDLQAEGLLSSRQGSKTVVAATAPAVGRDEGLLMLQDRMAEAAAMGLALQLGKQELERLFAEALRRARAERDSDAGSDAQ